MGCCGSSCSKKEPTNTPQVKYSWEEKGTVDRSLLVISDQEGGTVGRLPGQLNGRQFRIKNCRDVSILILDNTDSVTVEKCINCQIFIAPTKGSSYLRECTNCQFVIACQQFRVRDCKKCTISLFTSTQPVIESSTKLKFACYQCSYPQLREQFESIGQSVFNNCWSNIHDFDRGLDETNWTLLPKDAPPIISFPSEGEFSKIGVSLDPEMSLVPLTVGSRNKPDGETCLVVFFECENYEDRALEFTRQLHNKAVIASTKRVALQSHQLLKLFPQDESLHASASKGSVIVLEICGRECTNECWNLLEKEVSCGSVYVSPSSEQGLQDALAFSTITEVNLTM